MCIYSIVIVPQHLKAISGNILHIFQDFLSGLQWTVEDINTESFGVTESFRGVAQKLFSSIYFYLKNLSLLFPFQVHCFLQLLLLKLWQLKFVLLLKMFFYFSYRSFFFKKRKGLKNIYYNTHPSSYGCELIKSKLQKIV